MASSPFSSPEWLFEPKWDGYRALCYIHHAKIWFVSRNGHDLSKRFPALQKIVDLVKADSAVIDGEIVALDETGKPRFDKMRSRSSQECEIVFYAFDVLELDGANLRQRPLLKRKSALKKILPRRGAGRVRYTDHIIGKGEELFRELEKQGLEGMVAKRLDSLYVGGRPEPG